MLSFLYPPYPDSQPPRIPYRLNNVQFTLRENVERIQQYWQQANWSVYSHHFLVRVLNSLHYYRTESNINIGELYSEVRETFHQYIGGIGLGTDRQPARWFPKGLFYGEGVSEVIFETRFDDSIYQLFTLPWESWSPVRIVTHPFTALDYQHPNGRIRECGEKGYAVIKLDIALLYCQYHLWDKSEKSKYEDGTKKTMMNFLHSYPLANMIQSQTEVAWFNRLFHLMTNKPLSYQREHGRLAVVNPYPDADKCLQDMMNTLLKSKRNFHDYCCWVPGIWSKNLKACYQTSEIKETWYHKMPNYLGWLKLLTWLTYLELEQNTRASTLWVNELWKKHRFAVGNKTYGQLTGLPYSEGLALFEEEFIPVLELIK